MQRSGPLCFRKSPLPPVQLQSVARRYRQQFNTTPSGVGAWRWRSATGAAAQANSLPDDQISRRQRLEAVLFLAREPLNSRKLSQFANLADGTEARTLIRYLNQQYDESGRAFRIEEVAGGFQLLSRRKFAPWLRRLQHTPSEVRLSAPAMETLAVVAYRQPVLRAAIEAIRGVNCGEILRQLMERDLVRISGRSEELGRPYLYATTKRFLQLFGLKHLDDLPRADIMRSLPNPGSAESLSISQHPDDQPKKESAVNVEIHPPQDDQSQPSNAPQLQSNDVDDIDDFDDDEDLDDLDDDDSDDDEYEEDEWEEVEDDEEDWDDEEDDDWDDDLDDDEDDDEVEELF